jgi:hypothetical protein
MRGAVYNSAISDVSLNTVNRASHSALACRLSQFLFIRIVITILITILLAAAARAADWNQPEQELARKIVAVTGPGVVALTVENRSSLRQRDREIVENGLRSALEGMGLRFAAAEQSTATVKITLSENLLSYVWVAEIRQSAGDNAVVMQATPRPEGSGEARESVPLTLRKTTIWTQDDSILDVAVLEEDPAPSYIAVLDPEKVSLYRLQGGKWQPEQSLSIVHTRPWPRDLRGRLVPGRDHLLDAYLPGVICSSTATPPLALNCRASDDPWPLVAGGLTAASVFPTAGATGGGAIPQMKAFFASTRNFFTGALTPGVGKINAAPKFYSAAPLPREKYTLWLFAATDGQVHMIDGFSDQAVNLGWGSGLASLRSACGAGWQVLATSSGEENDSVRAYEFPDRDPVAVSGTVDLPGDITALWTEAKGDTAIVVVRDRETGSYEAFRLALACGQ